MVMRHSRLSGIGGPVLRPEHRLQPIAAPVASGMPCEDISVPARRTPFHLAVSLVAPDHAIVDLWKGDKFVQTVSEVDAADLLDGDLDAQGRISPRVIWDVLGEAKQMLKETEHRDVRLPGKSDVYGANYHKLSPHPRAD